VLVEPFHHREDVAFGVLEPRDLGAARGDHATGAALAGHVEVLERDASRLELGHFMLDVVDLPERLARLGRPRILGRVQEACGVVRELVRHAAGDFLARTEAERSFVEFPGTRDIPGRQVCIHRRVLQHRERSFGK
jgi:hypothetical protein